MKTASKTSPSSRAALKAWKTRRANARSLIAKKAWETRREIALLLSTLK